MVFAERRSSSLHIYTVPRMQLFRKLGPITTSETVGLRSGRKEEEEEEDDGSVHITSHDLEEDDSVSSSAAEVTSVSVSPPPSFEAAGETRK